jgi:hypothetical protein
MLLPSILWDLLVDRMNGLNEWLNIDVNMNLISFWLWFLNIYMCVLLKQVELELLIWNEI